MTRQELEQLLDYHGVTPDEEVYLAQLRDGRTVLNKLLSVRREQDDVIITHN